MEVQEQQDPSDSKFVIPEKIDPSLLASEQYRPKKPYHKPNLHHYGDVRDLTLSPSPQPQFESGRGFGFRS